MGGHDYCSAYGCSSRRGSSKFSFHRFPKQPKGRRRAWIHAMGRTGRNGKDWKPTENARVCSRHFVSSKPVDDPKSIDYIPTRIFAKAPKLTKARTTRRSQQALRDGSVPISEAKAVFTSGDIYVAAYEEIQDGGGHGPTDTEGKTSQAQVTSKDATCAAAVTTVASTTDEERASDVHLDHDYLSAEQTFRNVTSSLANDNQRLRSENASHALRLIELEQKMNELSAVEKENAQLKDRIYQLESRVFSVENIKGDNKKVQFYTSFANYDAFYAFFKYLEPKAERMVYWKGWGTTALPGFRASSSDNKRGRSRKLPLIEEYFAVLARLKVGLLETDIADRMGISQSYFSRVFITWVNLLCSELVALNPFPSQETVRTNMPDSFSNFGD